MLIWSDQMSAPLATCHSQRPVPRGRKDEFEPVVEVPDERGEPFGLGAGGGQGTVDVMAVVIPGSLVCAGFGRHRGHHRTAAGLHGESKRAARWAARRVHLRW